MKRKHPLNFNPNYLTISRFVLTLPLPFIFSLGKTWATTFTVLLIIGIGLTDFLDGWIARHYGQISDKGELIDSMADGFARSTIFILFTSIGLVPAWMVIICLWRDVIAWTIKGLFLIQKGQLLRKRLTGKIMGVTHSFTIAIIMVTGFMLKMDGLNNDAKTITFYAMLAATVASSISIFDLMITHKHIIRYLF